MTNSDDKTTGRFDRPPPKRPRQLPDPTLDRQLREREEATFKEALRSACTAFLVGAIAYLIAILVIQRHSGFLTRPPHPTPEEILIFEFNRYQVVIMGLAQPAVAAIVAYVMVLIRFAHLDSFKPWRLYGLIGFIVSSGLSAIAAARLFPAFGWRTDICLMAGSFVWVAFYGAIVPGVLDFGWCRNERRDIKNLRNTLKQLRDLQHHDTQD